MSTITVRSLDEEVKARLRIRAAENGRSMEAEIRSILTQAVGEGRSSGLLTTIRDRFGALGGVDVDVPSRAAVTRSPDFAP